MASEHAWFRFGCIAPEVQAGGGAVWASSNSVVATSTRTWTYTVFTTEPMQCVHLVLDSEFVSVFCQLMQKKGHIRTITTTTGKTPTNQASSQQSDRSCEDGTSEDPIQKPHSCDGLCSVRTFKAFFYYLFNQR